MDSQRLEFTGENVEEAIANGLEELGVQASDVLVEVIDEPSRGMFGIGAKPARVSLRLLRPPEPQPTSVPPPSTSSIPASSVKNHERDRVNYDVDDDDDYYASDDFDGDDSGSLEEDGQIAKEVLAELLQHMGIEARINVTRSDPTRPGENSPWLLDINGPNMSLLIGRRGDTLSSLQYITRLITSRRLQRRANIIVDAGGYKSRRSERLRELAVQMADQAVQQSRTISLEPMPPNERRIIHLELRSRSDVVTHSTGEGNSRKVTIVPK